jgi:hypothetical protein
MSKGAVIIATVVGGVVVLGLAGAAFASGNKPLILPDVGPPPPPPPVDTLGSALVHEGGKVLEEVGKNEYVDAYRGGSWGNAAKEYAINPYYAAAKGGARLAKKVWNSIF